MSTSSTFNAADGEGYNLQMGRWSRRLAGPFLDFVDVRDGAAVLDAGCGTGNLAMALKARCPACEVQAIDFSPAYIAYAKQHSADRGIAFAVGDLCDLQFATGRFDHVLSLLVLHFVPQTQKAIAEMRRVAKPGAVLAAAVWDAYGGMGAQRLLFDMAAVLDDAGEQMRMRAMSRPMTGPGELAAAWREGGLHEVKETALTIRMDYASFDDYWAPNEGRDGPGAQYVASLATDAKQRLRNLVRRAYLCGRNDGPRSFTATAWAVKGRVPA